MRAEGCSIDESLIRAACERGDARAATAAALEAYGAEVFGLIATLHRDPDDADEAFSEFAERLFTAMPRFEWRCSVRTWAYRLARNASIDIHRRAHRDRKRVPLSEVGEISALAARIRTRTISILRTEKRSELEKLRQDLSEDDRMLLVLRIDRRMAWRDIAQVVAARETNDDDALKQEAARLRKRFQLLKDRLRKMGEERGLL